MSHFTVLVVSRTPDVSHALAPYDENLDCESTFEAIAMEHMAQHYEVPATCEALLPHMQDWVNQDGVVQNGVLGYMTTRNPKAQWDWYQIGGRWPGMLKAKDPALAMRGALSWGFEEERDPYKGGFDQLQKSNLDIESMRLEAVITARNQWLKVANILNTNPPVKTWAELSKIEEDIDIRRQLYHGQITIQALKEQFAEYAFNLGELITLHREGLGAVLARERTAPLRPFAVIDKDGTWHERGRMGWWGVVHDEKPAEGWAAKIAQLLEETPDDWWLSVVDCHI